LKGTSSVCPVPFVHSVSFTPFEHSAELFTPFLSTFDYGPWTIFGRVADYLLAPAHRIFHTPMRLGRFVAAVDVAAMTTTSCRGLDVRVYADGQVLSDVRLVMSTFDLVTDCASTSSYAFVLNYHMMYPSSETRPTSDDMVLPFLLDLAITLSSPIILPPNHFTHGPIIVLLMKPFRSRTVRSSSSIPPALPTLYPCLHRLTTTSPHEL
jgi:hypothetical protein